MSHQPIGNHGLRIFDGVRFHLGLLLQGQTSIAKLKRVYNLLTPPSGLISFGD